MSLFSIAVAVILLVILVGYIIKSQRVHQNEPIVVRSSIPYVGHVINLLRHGPISYWEILAKRCKLPIYTVFVPGVKFYVVTSPELLTTIDRSVKTLTFTPFMVFFVKQMLDATPHSIYSFSNNSPSENGRGRGVVVETMKVMHSTLAGSKHLSELSVNAVRSAVRELNAIKLSKNPMLQTQACQIDLFSWTRRLVSTIVSEAIYGPKSLMRDMDAYNNFWFVLDNPAPLALNILPQLIARRQYKARKAYFDAMKTYYEQDGHTIASAFIQERFRVCKKYSICQSDIEHFDFSMVLAMLMNTVSITSWLILQVYSRPVILQALRDEIQQQVDYDGQTDSTYRVNIATILAKKDSLFLPFFHEVIRFYSNNVHARFVAEDTWLNDETLLKKDAILFIPTRFFHHSTALWGPNAQSIDPYRFVKDNSGKSSSLPQPPASAVRGFGNGAAPCPGQYFTENQVLSTLIILISKFDLSPTQTATWEIPAPKDHLIAGILPAKNDVKVDMQKRREYENVDWEFYWGEV